MKCDTFRLQIDAYADGALSPAERAAMDAHLTACEGCQAALVQTQRLDALLRTELPPLARATPAEGLALRQSVLGQLGLAPQVRSQTRPRSIPKLGWVGLGLALVLALVLALTLPSWWPGGQGTVSAAQIVDCAWDTVAGHKGMTGVLHWEAAWSQRFPGGQTYTRTFEIWFDFENPGRYRITHYDPDGLVVGEMVRDGLDHMWQLSQTVTAGGDQQARVDEILLSPAEMAELASWYVPSPFLDDLDRFTDVLNDVEKVAEIEVAGRPAYVLQAQLFGLGWSEGEGGIEPVTSTVRLVVDAETCWLLGRSEQMPTTGGDRLAVGFSQRTTRFELLPPERVPPGTFDFVPPPGAEVRTVEGIAGYYAPTPGALGLDEAAGLTSFTLVLPSDLPPDLAPRPYFRYQGPGPAGTFGILYLGRPGRQAFLLEYQDVRLPVRSARLVAVGEKQGWLVPDPIDGRKFSLLLIEPQPERGPDGRPWPRTVELQVWGLSVAEAVETLATLEPVLGD